MLKLKKISVALLSAALFFNSVPVMGQTVFTTSSARTRTASDYQVIDLTLDEAVEKAVKNSNAMKKINDSIKLAQSELDSAGNYVEARVGSYSVMNSSDVSTLMSYAQSEIDYAVNKLNADLQKESIGLTVLSAFIAIENAEKELALYEENLELSKKQLEISKVKAELGLLSQSSYNEELNSYQKSLTTKADKEEAIEDAYYSLSNMLGDSSNTRYNLTLNKNLDYTPLAEVDLEYYTTMKSVSDVNVIAAQKNLEIAELNYYIIPTSGGASSESKEISYNQASRAVGEAKDNLRDKITAAYQEIQTLQRNIENNENELRILQEQYEVKKVQLELGKITELELQAARYNIKSLEETLRTQKLEHYIKLAKFNEPSLL